MGTKVEHRTPAQKHGEAAAREELARLRKALKISAFLQTSPSVFGELKGLTGEQRTAALMGLSDEAWQEIARQAGAYAKKAPSPATRALVCADLDGVYARRDAQQKQVDRLFAEGDVNFRGCAE